MILVLILKGGIVNGKKKAYKVGDRVCSTITGIKGKIYKIDGDRCLIDSEEGIIQTTIDRVVLLNSFDDNINHPHRYTKGKVECIDAIEAAVCDLKGIEAFCTGNIIKYSWRWKEKEQVDSLKKAEWYLNHLIKVVERETNNE